LVLNGQNFQLTPGFFIGRADPLWSWLNKETCREKDRNQLSQFIIQSGCLADVHCRQSSRADLPANAGIEFWRAFTSQNQNLRAKFPTRPSREIKGKNRELNSRNRVAALDQRSAQLGAIYVRLQRLAELKSDQPQV
jgi:hypothetical protein